MKPALTALVLFTAVLVSSEERKRVRELGIEIGTLETGPLNAITDVDGVLVGHTSVVEGDSVRTGVTAVLPRRDVWDRLVPAAAFVLNGNGQLTGMPWIADSELLGFPILLTNSASVGRVYDAVVEYLFRRDSARRAGLQVVVAECWDGILNDIRRRAVRPEHVFHAIDSASSGPVAEGAVGAGVGMVSYGFKGGIGTSSRRLPRESGSYTVGALVLTNHGAREQLVVAGVPVGRELVDSLPQAARDPEGSSIIMIVATDAPLSSRGLERLARRATLGLARTGSTAHSSSGDIAIAFSTAQSFDRNGTSVEEVLRLPARELDALFDAAAEATEEAIVNSLTMAETTEGFGGSRVSGIPLDRLKALVGRQAN
jgi:D-aminopeptidase